MKTFLKWASIIAGAIILILVIGIIALPFVFPLEKIKDFAVAKLAETIHREVRIDKVAFDIFSGIKLQGLYVGNRTGFAKKAFVSADAIELRYAFWPLFSRQIIIKEIRLVKPQILVEKDLRGEFNFSDLLKPAKPSSQPSKPPNPALAGSRNTLNKIIRKRDNLTTKPPFNLFVSSFSIRDGKITYLDYSTKAANEIKSLNLKIAGFELALVKPIDVSLSAMLLYQGKDIPISLKTTVGIDVAKEGADIPSLSLTVAGESLGASASLSNLRVAPHLDFSARSNKFSVDPLLAVFAAPAGAKKVALKPGELTKAIDKATSSIPRNFSLNGKINVENLSFQKFKVDKIDLSLALSNKKLSANIKDLKIYEGALSGKAEVDLAASGLGYNLKDLKLVGFNASPFTNTLVESFLTTLPDYQDLVNKVYGRLDASLSLKGRGVEPQAVFANAVGDGSFSIQAGELKRLKTLAEVGKTLKSNTLQQDIKFGDLSAGFSLKNRIVTARDLNFDNPDIKASFNGGIDLGNLVWVPGNRLTLKLSPPTTKDLPKEFTVFRDEKGWLEMTFEITDGLKKPIPKPILEKPLEKVIGKLKVKIEAKKVEIEQKAKEELVSKETEAKKALEEEAKKKLKELIKF